MLISATGRRLSVPIVVALVLTAVALVLTVGLPAGAAGTAARSPLAGRVVVLDPGHDGGNGSNAGAINRPVPDGRGGTKACDTAGTSTADGYPEHAFTWDVAQRAAALLRARGATVVLTRPGDRGVGPCVDRRAAIGNQARAAAVVSIHADGGPSWGRGFHVLVPDRGPVITASLRLGLRLRTDFGRDSATRVADYTAGGDGLQARDDLAGLNLSRIPKVFIEMANMRNSADGALTRSAGWRQRAAEGVADGITDFVLKP